MKIILFVICGFIGLGSASSSSGVDLPDEFVGAAAAVVEDPSERAVEPEVEEKCTVEIRATEIRLTGTPSTAIQGRKVAKEVIYTGQFPIVKREGTKCVELDALVTTHEEERSWDFHARMKRMADEEMSYKQRLEYNREKEKGYTPGNLDKKIETPVQMTLVEGEEIPNRRQNNFSLLRVGALPAFVDGAILRLCFERKDRDFRDYMTVEIMNGLNGSSMGICEAPINNLPRGREITIRSFNTEHLAKLGVMHLTEGQPIHQERTGFKILPVGGDLETPVPAFVPGEVLRLSVVRKAKD